MSAVPLGPGWMGGGDRPGWQRLSAWAQGNW